MTVLGLLADVDIGHISKESLSGSNFGEISERSIFEGVSWPCARWHHLPRAGLGSTVATFLLLLLPPVPTVGVTPKLPKMSKVPSLVATQYCTRHQGSPTFALIMKRSPYRRLWIHPSISSVSRQTALLSRLTISFSCSTLWDPEAYGIEYSRFFRELSFVLT